MMPLLDGWKLIETARAEGIGTPIVVVSAERRPEHEEFAKEERPRVPEPSPPPSDRVQALPLEPVLSGGESPRHATPDGNQGGEERVRRGWLYASAASAVSGRLVTASTSDFIAAAKTSG